MTIPEYTANCPEGVYEKIFKVTNDETNRLGCMKIGDFARNLEKITKEHLYSFHISRKELLKENKIWVISWNMIQVKRFPKVGETIILRIWASKPKTGMSPRKYTFYSQDGEPLACAAALFSIMDSITRTMSVPSEKMKDIPLVVLPEEPALPKMIMPFPKEHGKKTKRTVCTEEIDKNGHLNNTHYLDWAQDLAKNIYGQSNEPDYVWIRYNKELLEGETAILEHTFTENTLYVHGYSEETESFSLIAKYV